jgi:hypothetical protein
MIEDNEDYNCQNMMDFIQPLCPIAARTASSAKSIKVAQRSSTFGEFGRRKERVSAKVFQDKNGGSERDHKTDFFRTIGRELGVIYTQILIFQTPRFPSIPHTHRWTRTKES